MVGLPVYHMGKVYHTGKYCSVVFIKLNDCTLAVRPQKLQLPQPGNKTSKHCVLVFSASKFCSESPPRSFRPGHEVDAHRKIFGLLRGPVLCSVVSRRLTIRCLIILCFIYCSGALPMELNLSGKI